VFVLFVEIPCRVPVEVLPTSLLGTRDLGSSSRFAKFKAEVELGHRTGNDHHRIDASGLEQRSSSLVGATALDSGLDFVLAVMVSGRDSTED
jgi:hypothetical protein